MDFNAPTVLSTRSKVAENVNAVLYIVECSIHKERKPIAALAPRQGGNGCRGRQPGRARLQDPHDLFYTTSVPSTQSSNVKARDPWRLHTYQCSQLRSPVGVHAPLNYIWRLWQAWLAVLNGCRP